MSAIAIIDPLPRHAHVPALPQPVKDPDERFERAFGRPIVRGAR